MKTTFSSTPLRAHTKAWPFRMIRKLTLIWISGFVFSLDACSTGPRRTYERLYVRSVLRAEFSNSNRILNWISISSRFSLSKLRTVTVLRCDFVYRFRQISNHLLENLFRQVYCFLNCTNVFSLPSLWPTGCSTDPKRFKAAEIRCPGVITLWACMCARQCPLCSSACWWSA